LSPTSVDATLFRRREKSDRRNFACVDRFFLLSRRFLERAKVNGASVPFAFSSFPFPPSVFLFFPLFSFPFSAFDSTVFFGVRLDFPASGGARVAQTRFRYNFRGFLFFA